MFSVRIVVPGWIVDGGGDCFVSAADCVEKMDRPWTREMKVEHTQGVASLTDEQIETAIAAIREMLDQREKQLDAGQLIEGKAEPVALPAPGATEKG